MYHTAAYSSSIALTSTKQPVLAVADNVFRIGASNGFVLQDDMMLIEAYAGGVGLANPTLTSPKLNQFSPLRITPFLLTGAVSDGLNKALWPYRPFTFRNQEEVTAQADNGNAAAQQETIVVSFATGIDPIPPGEEIFALATSTTAAIAFTWTLLTYTLSQTLPEGVYALISSEHQSTTAIAHRYTFWNQFYRPGYTSTTAFTNHQSLDVQSLQKGMAGQFSNVTLPNIEVFCGAADAAHNVILRMIKVQ